MGDGKVFSGLFSIDLTGLESGGKETHATMVSCAFCTRLSICSIVGLLISVI